MLGGRASEIGRMLHALDGLLTDPRVVRVLEVDPDLAQAIPKAEAAGARERSIALALRLTEGAWATPLDADVRCLRFEGLLVRRMAVARRETVELLGPGDVLAASEGEQDFRTVQTLTDWFVAEPATLAVLDGRWGERMAPWPGVQAALICRALERPASLMLRLSLAEIRNLATRLHLLLWHLADRWGRVYPDRVELPLRMLTHEILADLLCARRESVSRALGTLRSYDLVGSRPGGGWILRGPSPDTVEMLASGRAPRGQLRKAREALVRSSRA